ncbi:hypothetical protein [Vibrio mediterranei]|uniref:hypothetical protein n=1 Tax=Vibrio mediterranei TaxID=689 RepID=UPI004068425C
MNQPSPDYRNLPRRFETALGKLFITPGMGVKAAQALEQIVTLKPEQTEYLLESCVRQCVQDGFFSLLADEKDIEQPVGIYEGICEVMLLGKGSPECLELFDVLDGENNKKHDLALLTSELELVAAS